MNINVVKNMFGEMTPPPEITERKNFLIPVIVIAVACVGSFLIYREIQRQKSLLLNKDNSKGIY